MSAAADLLRSRDIPDIRMEDVARHAGVSKGTLYLYYNQREELFLPIGVGRRRPLSFAVRAAASFSFGGRATW